MGLLKRLLALASVALFIAILSRIDSAKVLSIIFGADPVFYLFSILLLACLVSAKALKWKLVLQSMGSGIPFTEALRLFLIGLFIGNITPGKLGDFAKALYLRGSHGTAAGLASVLLDRVVDVGILIAFAFAGTVSFIWLYNVFVLPPALLLFALLVFSAGVFLMFREEYLKLILRPVFNAIVPDGQKARLSSGFSNAFKSIKSSVTKKEFWLSVAAGLLVWTISTMMFFALSASISIGLSLWAVLLIFPVISLVDILPVSFSGIGTRDAALIFLLSFFSIGPEHAVALSMIFFFTGYILVSAAGFILFLLDPVDLKSFG
ncbi:Lysylphosphatidylglycerol synthase TM region [uncultured archaeon]|nr:Lysylphosphatidylglycerol synthase TM region [uncultured archaeon]